MKYMILNLVADEYSYGQVHKRVEEEFAKYPDQWVEVGFGLWLLRSVECAALIHWMESLCLAQKIPFVSATVDGPIVCGVEATKAETMKKLGIEVRNIVRK